MMSMLGSHRSRVVCCRCALQDIRFYDLSVLGEAITIITLRLDRSQVSSWRPFQKAASKHHQSLNN
jgi:hypothetical protein